METFRDYKDLNGKIHAPQELKDRVLWAAKTAKPVKTVEPAPVQKAGRKKPGRYSRGYSLFQKAAVAAVLLLILPATAYAAMRAFTIRDHLKERGFENIQAVEDLTNTFASETAPDAASAVASPEQPAPDFRNDYAEYRVAEAMCDSNTIYLRTEIKPTSDEYFIIPWDFSLSDDVSLLNLPGVSGMTIGEYIDSQEKPALYVSMGFFVGEKHIDGTYESEVQSDGTIITIYSGQNIADTKEFTLRCMAVALTPDETTVYQRDYFEVQVTDKSTSQTSGVKTGFDPRIAEEVEGLEMVSLEVEQTELATYFTFTYRCEKADDPRDQEGYNFTPVDAQGEALPNMPDQISTGILDNGDGTFSETVFCQKQASLEGIQFKLRRWSDAAWFGPYALPG